MSSHKSWESKEREICKSLLRMDAVLFPCGNLVAHSIDQTTSGMANSMSLSC